MVLQTDEQLRIWWHEPRKSRARTRLGIRSTASAIMNKNTIENRARIQGGAMGACSRTESLGILQTQHRLLTTYFP